MEGSRSTWRRADRARISLWAATVALALTAAFLTAVSSASAVTVGIGWSGNGARDAEEMPLVAAAGATSFRIPEGAINDVLVEDAARNHVRILAQLGGGNSLELTTLEAKAEALVKRYGVNGSFWSEPAHSGLPSEPITTWEIWNEPNREGIDPGQFGPFVNGVAEAIHSASLGGSPEVLFGGILANGDLGPSLEKTWAEMKSEGKGATLSAALKYLEEAYGSLGSDVDGIALHPYENNEASFYTPPGEPRYGRIEAFRYAVGLFHAKMVELAASHGGVQKSLSITEAGWSGAAPPSQWSVGGESQQATLLGQVITYAKNNEATLGLTNFDWYNYRDATGQEEWADNCGLRAADEHFRTAWTEFQAKAGVRQWVPVAPSVETQPPTGIGSSRATLNGAVNPHGLPTTYRFEYGTTAGYGNSVPVPDGSVGSGESPVPESVPLGNLQPGTTYHYRIVATNAVDPSTGFDRTFTTAGGRATAVVDSEGRTHLFFRASSGGLEEWSQSGSLWRHRVWGAGGAMAGKPAAVLGPEGKIFVYYRTISDQLAEWWFKGTESGYEVRGAGGDIGGDPSAFVDTEGRRWVYFRSPSGQLRTWWFKGSEWGHEEIGYTGNVEGTPSAFLGAEGKRFVYYRTPNGQIGEWWFKGSQWGHQERGNYNDIVSDPSAFVDSEGRNWVYFSSPSGQLRAWWFKGSEWGHEELGDAAIMEGTPSAFLGPEGKRYVYYLASDGQLGEWWFKGSEWGQREVGYHEVLKSLPTAVSTGKVANEVFYFGEGDTPYRWVFSGGGLNLSEISSPPVNFVPEGAAIVDGEGEPHLFYRGPAENLNEWYEAGSVWKHREWGSGGTMAGKPSAVLSPEGKIFVYYRTPSGQLAQWWIASGTEWGYELKGSAGDIASNPSALVDSEGRRWVYFSSPSGQLRAWWFKGIEWGHEELGYTGNVAGTPSAFLGPEGKRFVYYRTVNGQMGEWWFKGEAWSHREVGNYSDIASDPSAFVDSEGRNWVYFSSPSGQLRAWWFKGIEWGHEELGYPGSIAGMPAAFPGPEGKRYVYLQAADGQLGEWWFKSSEWSQHEWGYHEAVAASPTAVVVGSGERDVFVFNGEAWPYLWSFNGSIWSFRALE